MFLALVLVIIFGSHIPSVHGQQVFLSLRSITITTNNTEILITDIGEGYHSRPSLTCHTDHPRCCRSDNNDNMGSLGGEWYFPNGSMIPGGQQSYGPFVRRRNAPQVARLFRNENLNPLSPTGSYCCVIPTTRGEMTFCAKLVVCPSLSFLTNGIISYSDPTQGVGSVATHTCDFGYSLNLTENVTRTCEPDGQWSGLSLSCEVLAICPDLPTLVNGMLISYSPNTNPRLEGTVATHSCDIGYELSGGSVRTCQSNGTWSGRSITCKAVNCGQPSVSNNGQVFLLSGATIFNSLATYSCFSCYELEGISTRICGGDGLWIPEVPTCQVVSDCGPPAALLNGNVQTSPNTECGSVATYSCDCHSGYELEGESNPTCQPDGSWSGELLFCTPVDCGPLSAPSYGQVDTSSGTTFMSVATYTCNHGYIPNSVNSTCGDDGQWSPAAPTCKPVNCGSLSVLPNGILDISCITFMCIATYSCDTCYDLLGERSRTCTANGVWSSHPPACQIVDCGAPAAPENGLVSTQSGTTCSQQAIYSCLEGYVLTGSPIHTCTPSRQWSLSTPTCPPVNCGKLQAPSNGHVDTTGGTHFQSIATYSCDPGYNLTGCAVAECLSNGRWSCDPSFCADNVMIQLQFGPTRHCVEWTEAQVELMFNLLHTSITKAIQRSGHVIPKENVQQGYFSCYRSTTETTYRTTITGTERVSAVDYAALIQQWVDSGVTTRVLWYVIKFDKTCPVSISSMEEDECE